MEWRNAITSSDPSRTGGKGADFADIRPLQNPAAPLYHQWRKACNTGRYSGRTLGPEMWWIVPESPRVEYGSATGGEKMRCLWGRRPGTLRLPPRFVPYSFLNFPRGSAWTTGSRPGNGGPAGLPKSSRDYRDGRAGVFDHSLSRKGRAGVKAFPSLNLKVFSSRSKHAMPRPA